MGMSAPAVRPQDSNGPVVARIILAVICMVPGVIGILVLGAIAGAFTVEGFRFLDSDRYWMQLFLIVAACLIAPSIVLLGIILRYARWKKAPAASLFLAILYLVTDVVGVGLLENTLEPSDSENWYMLLFWAGVGLLIGALPPFLHWWNAPAEINP
jgi:hypothetical protein